MKTTTLIKTLGSALLLLGLTTAAIPSAQAQGNPNPGILPPQAVFNGKTAGEWTAAWWYWVLTTPGNAQMFDSTGEHAHDNNNGADGLFFLAKTWAGVPQTRTVTIPSGTPLLIPVMGIGIFGDEAFWLSLAQYGLPSTIPEIIDWANAVNVDMKDLSVRIDGKAVAGLEDGNLHYLNSTGLTSLYNPDGSVFAEIGYGNEISLILTPLTPGQHIIEMKGKGWGGFETDVTYHLTVQPGKK